MDKLKGLELRILLHQTKYPMPRIQKKLEQIRLQHKVSKILWKDNGVSTHFDYHVNLMSEEETIQLNVLTYNERHDEYMLLHTTRGASSIECLKRMLEYLEKQTASGVIYTFTIEWRKNGEGDKHISYFRARSTEEATQKFFHEKNRSDYEFSITQNPLS
ncbi:MAG: hypothetical protein KDC92_12535 [Bacteroidetes bacterium]|nr:hypothetical protein [Bacteroidota bacterium]